MSKTKLDESEIAAKEWLDRLNAPHGKEIFSIYANNLDVFEDLQKNADNDPQLQEKNRKIFRKALSETWDYFSDYYNFFDEELKKPEYKGLSSAELKAKAEQGDDEAIKMLNRASQQAAALADAEKERKKQQSEIMQAIGQVRYLEQSDFKTTGDNMARQMLCISPMQQGKMDVAGQIELVPIDYGNDASLLMAPDYDERIFEKLGLKKSFTGFDYILAMTLDNLYLSGNRFPSLTHIYKAMGNHGKKPKSDHLTDIYRGLKAIHR